MRKLICTLMYSLCLLTAYTQSDLSGTVEAQRNLDAVNNGGAQSMVRTYDNRYEGVLGSPYLFPDFYLADVWLKDIDAVQKLVIRYNIYLSELEFMVQGKIQAVPLTEFTQFVLTDSLLQNRLFVVQGLPLKEGEQMEPTLLEKIYDDGSLLYKEPKKSLTQANYQGAYSANQRADEFKDRTRYFLRPNGKDTFEQVRPSRASVLHALADQKTALKKFLKENGLILDSEGTLIRVLTQYDALTARQ